VGERCVPNTNARDLRKTMTHGEVKLWLRLRELRALGHHFRRQSPLKPYIVDFECRRSQVIVEVDGHLHGSDENRRRDAVRDQELAKRGYKVLRFSNGEIGTNIDGVVEVIVAALTDTSPHPRASRGPSPGGEG
jgi:very-short-patch-repair endonuclease